MFLNLEFFRNIYSYQNHYVMMLNANLKPTADVLTFKILFYCF